MIWSRLKFELSLIILNQNSRSKLFKSHNSINENIENKKNVK